MKREREKETKRGREEDRKRERDKETKRQRKNERERERESIGLGERIEREKD